MKIASANVVEKREECGDEYWWSKPESQNEADRRASGADRAENKFGPLNAILEVLLPRRPRLKDNAADGEFEDKAEAAKGTSFQARDPMDGS